MGVFTFGGFRIGLIIGAGQWIILRRWFSGGLKWALATGIGWSLGLAIGWAFSDWLVYQKRRAVSQHSRGIRYNPATDPAVRCCPMDALEKPSTGPYLVAFDKLPWMGSWILLGFPLWKYIGFWSCNGRNRGRTNRLPACQVVW
jgi:hypothetical protein